MQPLPSITLNETDLDDTAPVLAAQTFSYAENRAAGATVANVVATDNVAVTGFTFTATGTNTSADGYYQISNTGTVTLTAAGAASAVNDFEQAPNSGSYSITARDAAGNASSATLTLNETDLDEAAPTLAAQTFSYLENRASGATVATVVATDDVAVTGFKFSATGTDTSADGYYQISNTGVVTLTAAGAASGANDFETAPNAHVYSVTASDAVGNTTVANITLNETNVNEAPAGADKTVTVLEDASYAVAAADFGFTDGDGNALLSVMLNPASAGSLTLNGVAVTAGTTATLAQINSGLLRFTPAANANGTGYADFTFQVRDDGGTANGGVDTDASPNRITFNVTAVNDAPTTANVTLATTEDTALVLQTSNFAFADIDTGDTLRAVRITSLPAAGKLEYYNGTAWTTVVANTDITAADIAGGKLRFLPGANESGADVFGGSGIGNKQASYAAFTFQVSDGTAYSSNSTATVNVTPVADDPVLKFGGVGVVDGSTVISTPPASEGLTARQYTTLATVNPADVNTAAQVQTLLTRLDAVTPTSTAVSTAPQSYVAGGTPPASLPMAPTASPAWSTWKRARATPSARTWTTLPF